MFVFSQQQNGNVGIGTSTPQSKLHTVGNIQVTGELDMGNTGSTTGSPGTSGQILSTSGWTTVLKPIIGSLPSGGADVNNLNQDYPTHASITLPKGKWAVDMGANLLASSKVTADGGLFCHCKLSESDTSFSYTADLVPGTGKNGNGTLATGMINSMVYGSVIINNTSATSKPYYVWVDCQTIIFSGSISQRWTGAFGNASAARWLYAVPVP